MKYILSFLFLFMFAISSFAQQVSLEKWAKHNIDSLHHHKIDTLLYFNQYCDECGVKGQATPCNISGEDVQIENIIIYQQNGKFYTLKFNCNYPPIKAVLESCNSIPFALSIIPVLDTRDNAYKQMVKHCKFPPPIPTDGTSEYATIYLNKIKQAASIRLNMPDDLYKVWQRFYWFDKEVKLFKLIKTDLKDN